MSLMGYFDVQTPPPNTPVKHINGTPSLKIPEDDMKVAGLAFEAIILVMGLAGNFALLAAIKRSPRLKAPVFQIMMALAFVDLTYLCAVSGPHLLDYFTYDRQWLFGQVGCSLLNFLESLVPVVTGSLLVVCCWERFYAVCRPRSALNVTTKKMTIMILFVWAMGAAVGGVHLAKRTTAYEEYSDRTMIQTCRLDLPQDILRIYETATKLIFFTVAGVISLAFLACTVCKAMKIDFDYNDVKDDFKNHILRCVVLTTVIYILLGLPSCILTFTDHHAPAPISDSFFRAISRQMAAISGAVKPFIYIAASSQFRKSVFMALSCCPTREQRRPDDIAPPATCTSSDMSEKPLMNST